MPANVAGQVRHVPSPAVTTTDAIEGEITVSGCASS